MKKTVMGISNIKVKIWQWSL